MAAPQTIYDLITAPKKKPSFLRIYGPSLLALVIPTLFLVLFRLVCHQREWMNWLIVHITTPVKHAMAALFAPLPFAMAEVYWTVGVVGLSVFAVWSLAAVVKSLIYYLQGRNAHPVRRLIRRTAALLAALLFIYSGYTIGWGVNYYGDTFSQMSGLQGRKTTAAELYILTSAFAEKCSELADQVPRDSNGCFLGEGDFFRRSSMMYQCLYQEFPCLDLEENQAKPMFYSKIISYLGFTGFYFPFTGQSLVNVDMPPSQIPVTILHELAHQRNVAPEDECNFLAILCGLRSEETDFQYSSALMGYLHLGNALYHADRELWRAAHSYLSPSVLADLEQNNLYWEQFETPAAEAAEAVYSNFGKSYEQEDIMKSYGACVDLLAAYYLPPAAE